MHPIRTPRPLPLRAIAAACCALALAGCANTSRVLLAEPRPPIPVEQVRVYHTPPARYIEIARLETSSGVGFGTAGQTDSAMRKLREEAARLGANGVLLEAIQTVGSPVSIGIGGGRYGSRGGVSGGVGIPTAQRRAAGLAILVTEEGPASAEGAPQD